MSTNVVTIIQKLKYSVKDPLELAEQYYSMMNIFNKLELAQREVQLLAWTCVHKNIGIEKNKREFIEKYGSSSATVGNIISKLSKRKLLDKQSNKKIFINKALDLDFTKSLVLQISLEHASE